MLHFRQALDVVIDALLKESLENIQLHLSGPDELALSAANIEDRDIGQDAPLKGKLGLNATYRGYPREVVEGRSYVTYDDPVTAQSVKFPVQPFRLRPVG